MRHTAIILCLAAFFTDIYSNHTEPMSFSYHEYGKDPAGRPEVVVCEVPKAGWGGTCRTGQLQSPILLSGSVTDYLDPRSEKPIILHHYDEIAVGIHLKHHSIYLDPVESSKKEDQYISGGALKGKYKLHSAHTHWRSEHITSPEKAKTDLELHFVHYSEEFSNIEEAMKSSKDDALVVIGVLFDGHGNEDHSEFKSILNCLAECTRLNCPLDKQHICESAAQPVVNLRKLIPPDITTYYRYQGSLTTPPCSEVVTWIVYPTILHVSEKQSDELMKHMLGSEVDLSCSREVQKINGRDIYGIGISKAPGGQGPSFLRLPIYILIITFWTNY